MEEFSTKQLDELVFELLDPLHELTMLFRRKLLKKSKILILRKGRNIQAKHYPWSMLFLLDGSLRRHYANREPEIIDENHQDIAKPLFPEDVPRNSRLEARVDSQIIVFDRKLHEVLLSKSRNTGNDIEITDLDGTSSALFRRLAEDYSQKTLKIPRLPEVAERVKELVAEQDADPKRLHRLIELDPALATRMVQAAGLDKSRASVARATKLLGLDRVRDIIMSFALESICCSENPMILARMRKAYQHSVHVAAFSYVLAHRVKGMDPEHALLCGLLHDVGIFTVLSVAEAFMDEIRDEQELDSIVWKLHGMVGGLVLESWGFDRDFIATAEEADNWRRDHDSSPDYADVVLVGQLHSFVGTNRMKGMPQFSSVPAFRKLAGKDSGPHFSLWLLKRANQRINRVERLLHGCPPEALAG